MDLPELFIEFIQKNRLFGPQHKLLLALSGGMDSVVLGYLLQHAGYQFSVAHCNFKLRGKESDEDEIFCKSLAEKWKVKFYMREFDTEAHARKNKISIQEAARQLRYDWFRSLLKDEGYNFILTAHHSDDNVETSVLNYFRGTGIAGLRGMLPLHENIVRPLLFADREMLRAFADSKKLQWREDSSNETVKYSRNFIRHRLLPVAREIFPEADANITHNLERLRETEIIFRKSLDKMMKKLVVQKGEERMIPVRALELSGVAGTLLFEFMKPFGFSAAQAIEAKALMESATGRYISSDSHRLIRNRNWLLIAPIGSMAQTLVIEGEGSYEFVGGVIRITKIPVPEKIDAGADTALVDAALIKYPLIFRPWKAGDYFYPLGLDKKKKLSRFFIDQKLSLTEKERIQALEMDRKIIWVAGYRIDHRFRVTEKTREVLKIVLTK